MTDRAPPNEIRKTRDSKRMTQQRLGQLTGLSTFQLSRAENRATELKPESIALVLKALGIPKKRARTVFPDLPDPTALPDVKLPEQPPDDVKERQAARIKAERQAAEKEAARRKKEAAEAKKVAARKKTAPHKPPHRYTGTDANDRATAGGQEDFAQVPEKGDSGGAALVARWPIDWLFGRLPEPGSLFTVSDREKWLTAARAVFGLVYDDGE